MKKMILMVVAMLSMTMTTNATEKTTSNNANQTTVDASNYDMSTNMRRLAVYLGLDFSQMEAVEDIHDTFCEEMNSAANAGDERDEMVDRAIDKDLRHMRYVLTEKQYRKYLTVLNATLVNRGLLK